MTARAFLASVLVLAFSAAAFAQPPRPPAAPAPGARSARRSTSSATRHARATCAPPATLAPPAAPAPPPPPPAPPEPRLVGQSVNIRVDVTITDQRGGAPPLKKTVSVVTADGMGGRIRSQANYAEIGNVPLNVDAEPFILPDGKIRVRVNLQYNLPGNPTQQPPVPNAGVPRVSMVQENLALILENGKPLVAAQSADPVGDRQVTIELKATILK